MLTWRLFYNPIIFFKKCKYHRIQTSFLITSILPILQNVNQYFLIQYLKTQVHKLTHLDLRFFEEIYCHHICVGGGGLQFVFDCEPYASNSTTGTTTLLHTWSFFGRISFAWPGVRSHILFLNRLWDKIIIVIDTYKLTTKYTTKNEKRSYQDQLQQMCKRGRF